MGAPRWSSRKLLRVDFRLTTELARLFGMYWANTMFLASATGGTVKGPAALVHSIVVKFLLDNKDQIISDFYEVKRAQAKDIVARVLTPADIAAIEGASSSDLSQILGLSSGRFGASIIDKYNEARRTFRDVRSRSSNPVSRGTGGSEEVRVPDTRATAAPSVWLQEAGKLVPTGTQSSRPRNT